MGRVQEDLGVGDAGRVEVTVLVEQGSEAADEQPCDDQQRDGAGDLRSDEQMTSAAALARSGDARGARLQRRLRIDMNGAHCGKQPEDKGGQHGEPGGAKQYGPADVNVAEAGKILGRGGHEEANAEKRQQDPQRSA